MSKGQESINELIFKLEDLQLQQAQVVEQIKQARARDKQSRLRVIIPNSFASSAPQAVSPFAPLLPTHSSSRAFRIGSRIEITNKVGLRLGPTPSAQDRRGTVTKVTNSRVYFTTDNGQNTWRAHKNLTLV